MNISEKNNDRGASRVVLCIGAALAAVILIVALMVLPGMQQAALADCPCQPGYPCWPECLPPPPTYTPIPTSQCELGEEAPEGDGCCCNEYNMVAPYRESLTGDIRGLPAEAPLRSHFYHDWGYSNPGDCTDAAQVRFYWGWTPSYMGSYLTNAAAQAAKDYAGEEADSCCIRDSVWFIGNEPDWNGHVCADSLGGCQFSGNEYVHDEPEMSAQAYITICETIKENDPTAKCIPGHYIYLYSTHTHNWHDNFVHEITSTGHTDLIDGFALHGYPVPATDWNCLGDEGDPLCVEDLAWQLMDWANHITTTLGADFEGNLHLTEVGALNSICLDYFRTPTDEHVENNPALPHGLDLTDEQGYISVTNYLLRPLLHWLRSEEEWNTEYGYDINLLNHDAFASLFWFRPITRPEFWCTQMLTGTGPYTYTVLGEEWNLHTGGPYAPDTIRKPLGGTEAIRDGYCLLALDTGGDDTQCVVERWETDLDYGKGCDWAWGQFERGTSYPIPWDDSDPYGREYWLDMSFWANQWAPQTCTFEYLESTSPPWQ